MTIYRLEYDQYTCPLIQVDHFNSWFAVPSEQISFEANVPKRDFWGNAKGKYYIEGEFFHDPDLSLHPCPDICNWSIGDGLTQYGFALSEKAYQLLGSRLEPLGELLPVVVTDAYPAMLENTQDIAAEEAGYTPVPDTTYYCFNLLNTTDAIDPFNSRKVKAEGSSYERVEKLAFLEREVKDRLVFRTAYDNYEGVFCTDEFKDLTEDSGLTSGWDFHENLLESDAFKFEDSITNA